jgi:hypothetical protein
MSLSTGSKKAFSPSSVVEYARFPAKTWLNEDVERKDISVFGNRGTLKPGATVEVFES